MTHQIIKVTFKGAGARLTTPRPPQRFQCHRLAHTIFIFYFLKKAQSSGLTAGWLLSCLRTTPNIDDMADYPFAGGVLCSGGVRPKIRAAAEVLLRFPTGLNAH